MTLPTENSRLDVQLENFEGPLDLLLYLIKKSDLEIKDIPIAKITQEYLGYLDMMKDLNLETAGEFLVMASTLMQIKAQMLLPTADTESPEGPDPRTELINKLLEYQKFKEASSVLAGYQERMKDVYYRGVTPTFEDQDYTLTSSVFDLLSAFKKVLEAAPKEVGEILREEIPIEVKIREILDRLEESLSIAFIDLFPAGSRRIDKIVTFLALLELIRLNQAVARQQDIFGEIRIFRPDAAPSLELTAPSQEPSPMPVPAPMPPQEESPNGIE
jgi:segregation and condensation protein A